MVLIPRKNDSDADQPCRSILLLLCALAEWYHPPVPCPPAMLIRSQTVGFFHEHAGFEEALTSRVDDMRNAFFTACPITAASAAPTRKPWSRVCSTSCGSAKAPRNPRSGRSPAGERRVHQGLQLRRQSTLPADDGAAIDDAVRQGAGPAAPGGRQPVPQGRRGRRRPVAAPAFRRRSRFGSTKNRRKKHLVPSSRT